MNVKDVLEENYSAESKEPCEEITNMLQEVTECCISQEGMSKLNGDDRKKLFEKLKSRILDFDKCNYWVSLLCGKMLSQWLCKWDLGP